MKSIGTIKRGDTFSFTANLVDSISKTPLTGMADNLRCQGRHIKTNELIVEMNIEETETPGTYLFTAGSTDNWEVNSIILFDIQYTSDTGQIASSETMGLQVKGDITRD